MVAVGTHNLIVWEVRDAAIYFLGWNVLLERALLPSPPLAALSKHEQGRCKIRGRGVLRQGRCLDRWEEG